MRGVHLLDDLLADDVLYLPLMQMEKVLAGAHAVANLSLNQWGFPPTLVLLESQGTAWAPHLHQNLSYWKEQLLRPVQRPIQRDHCSDQHRTGAALVQHPGAQPVLAEWIRY